MAGLSRTILVLGGARSGKSLFAERLVTQRALHRVYLATGRAFDDEMEVRIAAHKARRGTGWLTVEAPVDLVGALQANARPERIVLVDCLTLWVTNLMMGELPLEPSFEALVHLMSRLSGPAVFVSNEVGLGIVPENAMARTFRDNAGRLNQMVAAAADEVQFIAAGLPLKLKG